MSPPNNSSPQPSSRTLVRGTLRQVSAFVSGGSPERVGGADLQCARDGQGRLTMSGTGLAGALVETAGRIFPKLFSHDPGDATNPLRPLWLSLTGKNQKPPTRQDGDRAGDFLQSVWNFLPSHCVSDLELRQGVGIRQATGAAAIEQKALYDTEQVPAGNTWSFFLDIDTLRAEMLKSDALNANGLSNAVEGIALLALCEWMQGRCWLGANPARGMGWFALENVQVLRLPRSVDALKVWPSNQYDLNNATELNEVWVMLSKIEGATSQACDATALWNLAESLLPRDLQSEQRTDSFWYTTYDITLPVGDGLENDGTIKSDAWGLDALAIGGHSAGPVDWRVIDTTGWLCPQGMKRDEFEKSYKPDMPVVTTKGHPSGSLRGGASATIPIPGSGLRGPLRHGASRVKSRTDNVPDPNHRDGLQAIQQLLDSNSSFDAVTELFGVTQQSSRVLVCDGFNDHSQPLRMACLQHHAEDEFTGGVYGSSKFNSTVIVQGKFHTRIVIEAPNEAERDRHVQALKPALALAKQRQLPIGKGKWSGCGWLKWEVSEPIRSCAGQKPLDSSPTSNTQPTGGST